MTLLTKILLGLGGVLLVGLLIVIVVQQIEIKNQQTALQTQVVDQKNLLDGITRSSSSWATKDDINNLLNSNGVNSADIKAIQQDLSKIQSSLTGANVITVNDNPQNSTNVPSSSTTANNTPPPPTTVNCPSGGTVECPSSDPYGYTHTVQNLALNENFGDTTKVPLGQVSFDASKQAPWSLNLPQRQYIVSNVIGTDANQKMTVYNKFSIKINGQTYEAPITTATTQQIQPSPSWSFDPRLALGADTGIDITHLQGALTPNLSLQIFGYGTYKNQPDVSVLQIGVGYNPTTKAVEGVLTPAAYNIGKNLPLMHNLYIGPSVQWGTDDHVIVGLGLHSLL